MKPLALLSLKKIGLLPLLLGAVFAAETHADEDLVPLEIRATEAGLNVFWGESNDPAVVGYRFFWKGPAKDSWNAVDLGKVPQFEFRPPEAGVEYAFRAAVRTDDGTVTPYSETAAALFSGVVAAEDTGFSATIRSIGIDRFPDIEINLEAARDGEGVPGLTEDDFSLEEIYFAGDDPSDPTEILDFSVSSAGSGELRAVDIVFVIDDTGSMGGEIASVRNNVIAFADQLEAQGFNFRLGLVRYKDENTEFSPDQTEVLNSGNLTDSKEQFQGWVSDLSASGGGDGPENGFGAIALATGMNFRAGSQRAVVLITDQSSHVRAGVTQDDAISLLQGINATCYVAGPSISQYVGAGSLTAETGGSFFSVTEDLSGILDDLSESIAEVYTIRYRTPNPRKDGELREVGVEVNDGGETASDTGQYRPEGDLAIELSPATAGKVGVAVPEPGVGGDGIPVAIEVTDPSEPTPTGARLFYRATADDSFSSVDLDFTGVLNDSYFYAGSIPAAVIQEPGLDFYFTATDGAANATLPEVDPSLSPFVIPVLPNEAPVIEHAPPDSDGEVPGEDVAISARVTDTTESVAEVRVSYTALNEWVDTVPKTVTMSAVGGDQFEADLPGTDFSVKTGGFLYRITAVDNFGVSSTSAEFVVFLPETDSDSDGLTNLEEYLGKDGIPPGQPADSGDQTDPTERDSDGDSLWDGWEVKGIDDGEFSFDLAAAGADPLHKDLFVEIDYLEGGGESFRPAAATLDRVVDAFAAAPVSNPDGEDGIRLHYVIDDAIPRTPGREFLSTIDGEYKDLKDEFFPDDARRSIFRWALFGNKHSGGKPTVSGRAEGIPSGGFLVTLGGWSDSQAVAGTFMHELGHTIGLRHGGTDNRNYKPNYVSIMNYFFQFEGLIRDETAGVLDFSRRDLPDLAEDSLDEETGIGDAEHRTRIRRPDGVRLWIETEPPGVDWDRDGGVESGILAQDLDGDRNSTDTFDGHDDWDSIVFIGGSVGDSFAAGVNIPPFEGEIHGLDEERDFEEVADTLPAAPPALEAIPSPGSIALDWPAAEDPSLTYWISVGNTPGDLEEVGPVPATDGEFVLETGEEEKEYIFSVVAEDGFGNRSADASTVSATSIEPVEPDIAVGGAGLEIVNGDSTPRAADGTDFGSAAVDGGSVSRIFTVQNMGTGELTLSVDDDSDHFFAAGLAAGLSEGESDDFTVTFDPAALGTQLATISIESNDPDENPFTFAVGGVGTELPDSPDDAYGNNHTRQDAYPFDSPDTFLSEIGGKAVQGNDDWYAIEVSGDRLAIRAKALFEHAEGDIDLQLVDSSGVVLTGSVSVTDNEAIYEVVDGPGTYYLRVFFGDAGNEYDLWWYASEPLPEEIEVANLGTFFLRNDGMFRSDRYGTIEIKEPDDRVGFSQSLQSFLNWGGSVATSDRYGTLRTGADPQWLASEYFGWTYFGLDYDDNDGWVSSERFGWMKFFYTDGIPYLWVIRDQHWMQVNPDGSFLSFSFGPLRPISVNSYASPYFGTVYLGDHGGWFFSTRFGWVWAAREGDGRWYFTSERGWLGLDPNGSGLFWSVDEGRWI